MRIEEINNEHILFDTGDIITFDHEQDCCEYNYADFEQIEEAARAFEFEKPLIFETVDGAGFRFGNRGASSMFFVPCYSSQNGYYSTDIDIYFNGEEVLSLLCEEDFA